jgi:hypothetical protein
MQIRKHPGKESQQQPTNRAHNGVYRAGIRAGVFSFLIKNLCDSQLGVLIENVTDC